MRIVSVILDHLRKKREAGTRVPPPPSGSLEAAS
jgi:hypothetical protein